MPDVTVNTSDYAIRCAREDLLAWGAALDAKRPRAWQQYGYPDVVTFAQLRQAYERGGPGHGAVHRLLGRCWLRTPRLKRPNADAETPAEQTLARLLRTVGVWRKLRDLDRRNLVGHYAALIYRVADGRALSEPLERARALVDLVPLFENQIKVTKWDSDTTSPTFGQPLMWQYRMRSDFRTDVQGRPEEWADVHPSRVQVLAEGAVGGDFFDGTPLLRSGLNHLIDLEKIGGGSAESFLKNSARTVVLKFDTTGNPRGIGVKADGTPITDEDVAQAIEEKVAKLNRSIDSAIVTQGGDATTLQTTIADPTGAWMLAANLFAASVQIPFTILFGQQTGRLASDEDKADFTARCVSRQVNELTPMIEEFVSRMQACGVIESGDWDVEWPPLDAPGDEQKANLLGKMTAAMQQAFSAGLTPLFDANELRGVLDYEPRADDGMPTDGDIQPEDDPAAPVPLHAARQPPQQRQPKQA